MTKAGEEKRPKFSGKEGKVNWCHSCLGEQPQMANCKHCKGTGFEPKGYDSMPLSDAEVQMLRDAVDIAVDSPPATIWRAIVAMLADQKSDKDIIDFLKEHGYANEFQRNIMLSTAKRELTKKK